MGPRSRCFTVKTSSAPDEDIRRQWKNHLNRRRFSSRNVEASSTCTNHFHGAVPSADEGQIEDAVHPSTRDGSELPDLPPVVPGSNSASVTPTSGPTIEAVQTTPEEQFHNSHAHRSSPRIGVLVKASWPSPVAYNEDSESSSPDIPTSSLSAMENAEYLSPIPNDFQHDEQSMMAVVTPSRKVRFLIERIQQDAQGPPPLNARAADPDDTNTPIISVPAPSSQARVDSFSHSLLDQRSAAHAHGGAVAPSRHPLPPTSLQGFSHLQTDSDIAALTDVTTRLPAFGVAPRSPPSPAPHPSPCQMQPTTSRGFTPHAATGLLPVRGSPPDEPRMRSGPRQSMSPTLPMAIDNVPRSPPSFLKPVVTVHRFRAGEQDGYTRSLKTSALYPLSYPPDGDWESGDVFLHEHLQTGDIQVWVWDLSWVVAQEYDAHPTIPDRYLCFRSRLEPSWVKGQTVRSYKSRRRQKEGQLLAQQKSRLALGRHL